MQAAGWKGFSANRVSESLTTAGRARTRSSTWTPDPNTTPRTTTANRPAPPPAPRRAPGAPRPPGPEEPSTRTRPRLRKLRFAFVLLGLTALAFVSWIFGIMMAVAQDLPALENREQYKHAENSVVYDAYGQKLATLTNNEGRILIQLRRDRPGDEGGRGRDRGPALLRAQRRRLPGHRPRRLAGRHLGLRPSREPRRSPSSSSRTRSRPRTAGPCSRSSARPRSPTTSRSSGPRTRSSPSTSTRSTSARARPGSRPPPRPTSATTTRAAARAARPAPPSSCHGRPRCSPG